MILFSVLECSLHRLASMRSRVQFASMTVSFPELPSEITLCLFFGVVYYHGRGNAVTLKEE
jgi:hypothetical protein